MHTAYEIAYAVTYSAVYEEFISFSASEENFIITVRSLFHRELLQIISLNFSESSNLYTKQNIYRI